MREPMSGTPQPTDPASVVRPSIVYFLLFGAVGAYFPYISVFFRSVGLSLGEIGVLAALAGITAVVAAPLWGAVVDRRRDVRWPLLVAGAWSGVSAVWLGLSHEPLAIALAVTVLAAGSAGLGPMLDTRTIEIVGSNRERYGRARAWGSLAFTGVALAVGALIGSTGAVGLFLVLAPGYAITGLVGFALLGRPAAGPTERGRPAQRRVTASFGSGLAGIIRDPSLLLFFVGSVLVWTSVSAVTTFLSIHLVDLGAESAVVGLVWTPGALVEVPMMLAFPLIVRRVSADRLIVIGALAFAARTVGWALVSDPILYVLIAPLGGVAYGLFFVGTVTYVSRAVPATVQATAQGIFTGTAFSMGAIIGSVVGGELASALTISGMFGVAAVATLVGAGIVWRAIEARKTELGRRAEPALG
jgi:MFS transporter, PPP family, 3-phenylpropionic acid transporter